MAECAARFAEAFGYRHHGLLAGIWHDLGKYSREFQDRIRGGRDASIETVAKVDHSTFGAQHADATLGRMGWLIAYCIAGHHAGLANAVVADKAAKGPSPLAKRLSNQNLPRIPAQPQEVAPPPDSILRPPEADPDLLIREVRSFEFESDSGRRAFQLAFATRMLFSALVDADSLCTERFCNPESSEVRKHTEVTMADLAQRLRTRLDAMCRDDTTVNRARSDVLRTCRARAADAPGLFSLTVPTGGGKTLSSLSFALEHAAAHGLRRVIYAIPFTSIIEQNADVIRQALTRDDEQIVLEHHSSLEPKQETRWSSQAAENWEAPVVLTTNVQLFDSLFANARSRCRRLHNLAKSVIVLDEAQAIPVHVLEPCLAALQELVTNYGCTVVLCTATQPAIQQRIDFPIGLPVARELIDDVPAMFATLRRTRVDVVGERTDEQLVNELLGHPQALCIVNTRSHAAELFAALRGREPDGAFHLSALLCAAHRSATLRRIRDALAAGRPCRLISTQVIEAGVDVDFPLVMRAMAGLDSIAQAAGRCNREGHLQLGIVQVFETDRRPSTAVKGAAAKAREVLPDHRDDALSPNAIESYFRLHYWLRQGEWDQAGVMDCFRMDAASGRLHADFHTASNTFRMIDDSQKSLLVPYGKGGPLFEKLRRTERPDRFLLRQLQRYTVGVYDHQLAALLERRVAIEHDGIEGLFMLAKQAAYDDDLGLRLDAAPGSDALIT